MRVIYNHDMTTSALCITEKFDYKATLDKAHIQDLVYEIADTDVEIFSCSPTLLRQPLWPSKVQPHWTEVAPYVQEPQLCLDWGTHEFEYFRFRRYILDGNDPIADVVEAVKQIGKKLFFALRMNDVHEMLSNPKSMIIDDFWKEHPEHRIGEGFVKEPLLIERRYAEFMQDYLKPEIPAHYFSLLDELTQMYDIDGLELDFIRHPCFCSPDRTEEVIPVITQLVRDVRAMLDRYGKERCKRLELSVRVAQSPAHSLAVGLDTETWVKEGLIDILNITRNAVYCTTALDIEGYKAFAGDVPVIPEMLGGIAPMNKPGRKGSRKTTAVLYRTYAQQYLARGADGLSFFNFVFCRKCDLGDRRREMYRSFEPPFEALQGITNLDALRQEPKHYYWGRDLVQQKAMHTDMSLPFDLYDDLIGAKNAVLRIETAETSHAWDLCVLLNGVRLREFTDTGELFRPIGIEALPENEQIRFFEVPLSLLKDTGNFLTAATENTHLPVSIAYTGVELAIYR